MGVMLEEENVGETGFGISIFPCGFNPGLERVVGMHGVILRKK
jgi:hypothetical protein